MEFLSKDKLAALEEERQQRRKARAEAAQQRLAEVGKQTQQMVQDHVSPNNADSPDQKQLRIGGLSRVLYEQAQDPDGRRGARKNRGMDQLAARTAGFDALKHIDEAMNHINTAARDVTGAAMKGGLEDAAKSVNAAVDRVSAAVNIAHGGRQPSAKTNPLAEIMAQEADDSKLDTRADMAAETERSRDTHALQHEMSASLEASLGGGKLRVGGANLLGSGIAGDVKVDFGAAFGLAHEATHVVQARGNLPNLGEELKDKGAGLAGELAGAALQTPGKLLATAETTVADVTKKAEAAPKELHAAAKHVEAGSKDEAKQDHPRDLKQRAADATRIIAEDAKTDLKDAPSHVVDNVLQVAAHVALHHESAGDALKDIAVGSAKDYAKDVAKDSAKDIAKDNKDLIGGLADKVGLGTSSSGGAASDIKGALDTAREHLDPRKLGADALQQLDPRGLVESATRGAIGMGELPRELDPRRIAEQTIGSLDARAQLRGSVDPAGLLGTVNLADEKALDPGAKKQRDDEAAKTKPAALDEKKDARNVPDRAGPQTAHAGPTPTEANPTATKAAPTPPAAQTAPSQNAANPAGAPAGGAANAPQSAAAKDQHADAKHAEAKVEDKKHADAKHDDKKHDAKHGDTTKGHAQGQAAHHASQPHHAANNHPHQHPGSGGVHHAAAPHSSTGLPGSKSPPQAPPPAPSPTQRPHNAKPAAERQAKPTGIAPSKDKTQADIKPNGDTQLNLQSVPTAQPPPVQDRKANITQPSFNIESKIDNGQTPQAPPPMQPPTTTAPPPAPAAAPAQTTTPTTSNRQVAPLAAAPAAAPPQSNPAIASARSAAGAVKVPQGSISPLPASTASAAPGAAPAPASAAAPGPAAVATSAAPAPAPQQAQVPPSALPATPTPAAPATNSPTPAAPTVAPVKSGGGGDNIPDPSSLVQTTVSLSPDRSAATSAITSEAQTQSKVAPEAQSQRQSQIGPLPGQMQTTGKSADAPMASATSSASAQGASAAASGKAQEAAKDAQGKQQIAGQMAGAQAERSQFAAMPQPAIIQQTNAAAMAPVAQAAATAVQAAANAVAQAPVNLDPAVLARGHAATAVSATLPPFDAARFNQIDQHAPLPPTNTAAVDAANVTAQGTYQQAGQQIQNLANIPAPTATAPKSPMAGQKTSSGYPTREAAIAEIEQQVTAQSNAQGPAQMKAAAAPVQDQLNTHVQTNQQQAQAHVTQQVAAMNAQAQQIAQQAPPITGAQAAAQAQPEYQAHQAAATQAHTQMQTDVGTAQQTAQTGITTAKGQRNQQVQTANQAYSQEIQGQVMPQYQAAQTAAQQQFTTANQTAQTTLAADQTSAQTEAQTQADAAKAKADADISSHQAAMTAQQNAAHASHQQQAAAATASHQAQMNQQQAQMDAQVAQHQSEMHSQIASQQQQGQQEINQHLTEGEQGYQNQIQQGTQQANAEKAKAEQEAAAKKAQADEEKKKHSGGILGGIIGWVKDRIDDLMNAMKAVLEAAKNMVVSIMEKARQAAMAVLEKARQAALAVMNKVKGAIQGIISACASAIRSVISACAAAIKGLIQALASALQALVAQLTAMLHALVSAFQMAVNAALDMMIAAVSLVNKNLGDKLRNATQKYRDAFNNAMNGLKSNIDKAGQALEHGIQAAADKACAVVDAAEKTLNDAVTRVEQTLNNAVEAIYQKGVQAINAAFDAAEFVVNKAFDVAEAGVKAFFDAQIAQLDIVQKGIDAVADFAATVADKAMEFVDKMAQAVVSMIPDSWKKAFVDFWNGPWRSVIIIGLATVAAVALTVATGGVAGVLLAGVIGGSIAGGAYFGGEMVARESEISLSSEGKGMYIPGFGDVQIGPDGKPIPPPGLSPEKLEEFNKQGQWATSNFNMQKDENGNVTGYDRKDATQIANYALEEGAKGFVEGAISGSLAVAGGGLGGLASKGLGLAEEGIASSLVSAGVSNVVTGPVQNSLTQGFDAAFEAIKDGKNPAEAFKAGLGAAKTAITDPSAWITAGLTMGVAPVKLKFLEPLLEKGGKQVENKALKYVISKGGEAAFDTVTNTLTAAGGAFAGTYAKALAEGKTQAQALELARKAADESFTPEAIATNALMSTAGALGNKPKAHGHPEGEHGTTGTHPTEEHPGGAPAHETEGTTPNEANARTSTNDDGSPRTDPNTTTEHVTSAPKPEDHPTAQNEASKRSSEIPGVEEPPKETGQRIKDEPVAATADERAAGQAPDEAKSAALHEPTTKQVSEHEPRLKSLEHDNPDNAPPQAIAAVREARAEIAKLKRLRTRAERGTGVWEHATPEERAARVKTLEDHINNIADHAVANYDKAVNGPKSDADTLAAMAKRTPEQKAAREAEVKKAREETAARDKALVDEVAGKTINDGHGNHVNQVFDHVTIGSGFAGVANEMSRPNVQKGDIVIGGANPWDGAKSKFGQQAGQSEVPNHSKDHSMVATSSDPTAPYMVASEHADNVALNKNDAEIRTYNGQSGPLEPGPKPDWPAFAREGGANARIKVTGPDGVERYFYTKQADLAGGPGPNRRLGANAEDESVLSMATIQEMLAHKDEAGNATPAFAYGDQSFTEKSVRPGEVGIIGAGAAGAWAVEASANRTNEHGQRVSDVEWIGAMPRRESGAQLEKLKGIQEELRRAKAADPAEPAAVKAAEDKLKAFTFEEAIGNGNLPRNQQEKAAFHRDMQKGNVSEDGVPGNVSRRVMDGVEKVTFEPQTPGGPKRVKIVLKDKGADGQPIVIWKDSLVVSIGQDAKGTSPKGEIGPAKMLAEYKDKLKPIYGPPDETGFRPIVGVQSEDGSVRVLGAAATPREVSDLMNHDVTKGGISTENHQANLAQQANAQHIDSKGVVPGFVMSQRTIETANSELARKVQLTAAQQRAEEKGLIPRATEPVEATPVDKLPQEKRDQAAREYKPQIEALERDGRIPMPSGKASVKMMADITAATGKEVALVRLKSGERVLLMGHEHHVDVPEGSKIIAHTHPNGDLQLSFEDEMALHARGQKTSVLIGADGTAGRFGVHDDVDITGTRSNSLHEPTGEEGKDGKAATPKKPGEEEKSGPTELDPFQIKFTQATISPVTNEGVPLEHVQASMHTGGWKGEPAPIIRMEDGSFISLNNRRIVAAQRAITENGGLGHPDGQLRKTIPVEIHEWTEELPAEEKARYVSQKNIYRKPDGSLVTSQEPGAVKIIGKGQVANTYGEAAIIRNSRQNIIKEGPKQGQRHPLDGSYDQPFVQPVRPQQPDDPTVQRKATGDADTGALAPHEVAKKGTAGSGGQLPYYERIQAAFGRHDISGVRAHVGGEAAESSRALGASAYAMGDTVAFASAPDLHTAAHEAAHVVQQRAGVAKAGGLDGGASDEHEKHADAVADAVVAGGDASALLDQVAAVAASSVESTTVQRKGDAGTDAIANAMTSKDKAAEMLRHTPPANRGTVEAIIRQKFKKEDADEIITKNPSGGQTPPKAQTKGQPKKTTAGADAKKGKGGKAAAKSTRMPTRGKTGAVAGKVAEKHEEGVSDIGAFKGVSTNDLTLIHQELIEHEEWKAAKAQVGGAESTERATFIAEQTGKSVYSAGGQGLATGFLGGAATVAVGKLATAGLAKAGVAVAGEEIPGLGPIIAGAFSAYALYNKNWKEAGETISKFNSGEDTYDKLANSLAAVAEVIDILCNVLNVIAAIVAAIGLVMWIVTIVTLGAAAPIAVTLTEIAAAVVTVTLILDAISKLAINPMILLFRAMHTFKSEADPRDVKEQGDVLSETANQTVGFIGNIAGSKVGEKVGEGAAKKIEGHGDKPADPGPTETRTPEAKPAESKTPEETKPAETKPAETKPEETKPAEGKTEGEESKQEQPKDEKAEKAAKEAERKQKLKEAEDKVKAAKDNREKIEKELDKKLEENRKAREKAEEDRKAAHEKNQKELDDKLESIKQKQEEQLKKIEAERAAEVKKIDAEATRNNEQFEKAERAAEVQKQSAAKAKEANVAKAKEQLDAKTRAADERLQQAETEATAKAERSASKEFSERESANEAKHNETVNKLNEIEDPEIRAEKLHDEEIRYNTEKSQLAKEKAARSAELAKPDNQAAKASHDRDVKAAQDQFKADEASASKAEADANAKTDKDFAKAQRRHEQQLEEAARKQRVAEKRASDQSEKVNEDAEGKSDRAKRTRDTDNEEANKTADETKKELKDKNVEARRDANKELKENTEEREKAEEEVDEHQSKGAKAAKIIYEWGIKPFLLGPFSWSINREKAGKDIDFLPPWETTKKVLENTDAAQKEKAEKKKQQEEQENALRPQGDAAADPKHELGEAEEKYRQSTEAADKKREERAAETGKYTKHAPKFGQDFVQGLAGKEGDSVEKTKRKVSPNYVDPPFSEAQLTAAKNQIESDLAERDAWAQKKAAEAAAKAKETGNKEKIAEAKKMATEAKEAGEAHKQATERKDAAIAAQQQRSKQAGDQGQDAAHRMAGMVILEVPLKVFQGATWMFSKAGGSVGAKAAEMNADANKFASALQNMKQMMNGNNQQTAGTDAGLQKDQATNQATKAKAGQTGANLDKAEKGWQQGEQRIQGAVEKHTQAGAEAGANEAKKDGEAKTAQSQYQQISAGLTNWAKAHQQARIEAQKKALTQNTRAPRGDLGGHNPANPGVANPTPTLPGLGE